MRNLARLLLPGSRPEPGRRWLGPEQVLAVVLALSFGLHNGLSSGQASCTACTDFQPGTNWGAATLNALTEASGIAASRRNPGVLWTHNDGTRGRIYALGTNGSHLATFDLNHDVDDLEDIAVGPGPVTGRSYLYVGDIGGNAGSATVRSQVQILRVPEPLVDLAWEGDARSDDFEDVETFTLSYPDGSFDAEALMVDPTSGDLLIATKQNGSSSIYAANLAGVTNGATVPMTFMTSISFGPVSAGDISADGRQIALRRENAALLWARCDNESIAIALSRDGQGIPVIGPPDEPNGEAIAFLADGSGYVTISEGTDPPIYFFQSLCPAGPTFILPPADQSVFMGGSVTFRALAAGFPQPNYEWRFAGQLIPGQTNSALALSNVTAAQAGQYEVTASNESGTATSAAALIVRTKPDLRITEVLSSPAPITGLNTADWWELTSFESQPVSLAGWRFNDNTGGLTDAFVFPAGLVINPAESIVFADGLTPAGFRAWWGSTNLPADAQIITYSGNGLGFGASGDAVRLWNDSTTDPNDTIASVEFGAADSGVTFNYDPVTGQFGGKSQVGVNGVIRAVSSSNDIGSPGRILAPAVSPALRISRVSDMVRIAFDTAVGHRYVLEVRSEVTSGTWAPTGDTFLASNNGTAYFERAISADHRFYRVMVE